MKTYIDISFNDNQFQIIHTESKPCERGCALATLNKIERALKMQLTEETLNQLQTAAASIRNDYNKKFKWMFGKVERTYSRVKRSHLYADIVIKDNQFNITYTGHKPHKRNSALITLGKIEKVLKEKLSCPNVSQEAIYSKLKIAAATIREGSNKKFIFAKLFGKVERLYSRIQNLISPPKVFPLPDEITQEICQFLDRKDLRNLALVNLKGHSHAEKAFLSRAQKCGYEGNAIAEAKEYLKKVYGKISYCAEHKYISDELIVKTNNVLDHEATWQKLQLNKKIEELELKCSEDLYMYTALHNIQIVQSLLRCGINPNIQCIGKTPLHQAVRDGRKGLIIELLKHQADPNIADQWGDTSLHQIPHNIWHTNTDNPDIAKLLIKHGAQVNYQNPTTGETALHLAAVWDYLKTTQILLQAGANLDIQDNNGKTPLHLAAEKGRKGIVQILLQSGADRHIQDNNGEIPRISHLLS